MTNSKQKRPELNTRYPIAPRCNFHGFHLHNSVYLDIGRLGGIARAWQRTQNVQSHPNQIRSLETNVNCDVACLLTANDSPVAISGRWWGADRTYAINSKQLR